MRAARRVFSRRGHRARRSRRKKGIERLEALVGAWHGYIAGDTFEGGCLLMEASAEFDNRPGPVRDLIAETMGMWMGLLVEQAERALERGELAPGTIRAARLGAARVRARAQLGPPAQRRRRRPAARGRRGQGTAGRRGDREGPRGSRARREAR